MAFHFDENIEIIREALDSIDIDSFEQLVMESVDTLMAGHKIVVSGLGKNVSICDKFVGSMISLGLNANFLHTNSAVHGDMGMVKAGDMVIVLTKSGATRESVYLVDLLRQRKDVNLWLMTFEQQSILANTMEKKIVMMLKHEGDPWNVMPNNSTTVNLIVLQTLVMALAERMNLDLDRDFKPNHPGGAIGARLSHE